MKTLTNGLIDFSIPASWAQSLNPVFIVILAPVFATLWMKLGKLNPPTVHKFAFGAIIAGLSYLVMIIPLASGNELINPLWLVLSFLLISIVYITCWFINNYKTCTTDIYCTYDEFMDVK